MHAFRRILFLWHAAWPDRTHTQVLHGRIPERHPYSPAPVAVYASLNDFVGSFRHALFDFIVPVFNLLQLFRMYTPDFLLLEAQHQVMVSRQNP